MAKHEITHWRDEELSKRHRQWGYNCPAIDVDFLLIEFDSETPIALIDYKRETAPPVSVSKSPGLVAVGKLGNMSGLPAFVVRYAINFSWFKVLPLNKTAEGAIDRHGVFRAREAITESQWVEFLYFMRGRKPAPDLF